jgi:hypothetical protein
VLGEILLEATVMIDFKCPPEIRDWHFVLLLFIREKFFTRISAAEYRSHSLPKGS